MVKESRVMKKHKQIKRFPSSQLSYRIRNELQDYLRDQFGVKPLDQAGNRLVDHLLGQLKEQ